MLPATLSISHAVALAVAAIILLPTASCWTTAALSTSSSFLHSSSLLQINLKCGSPRRVKPSSTTTTTIFSANTDISTEIHPAVAGWPEKYKETSKNQGVDVAQTQEQGRGPKILSTEFAVVKASSEYHKYQMDVANWPTWTTGDKAKWAVGNQNAHKIMPYGELSYMITGKLEVIPEEGPLTGQTVIVEPGDFVTFPQGFQASWRVLEELTWHYYLY